MIKLLFHLKNIYNRSQLKRGLLLFLIPFLASSFVLHENPIFENFNSSDGLSQHDINCILQDKDGFLWFGTNDGLNKYDGYNFKVFKPSKNIKSSISGRIIQKMVSDSYGNLWIASLDGGLNYYDTKQEAFFNFSEKLAQFGNYANDITLSDDGVLWIQFKQKTCYAVLKENFEDMEFRSLLNDDTNSPREKLGNKILQKNRKLFFSSSQVLYSLSYTISADKLRDVEFIPNQAQSYASQIIVSDGVKWELYNDKIIFNGEEKSNLTVRVNNLSNRAGVLDWDKNLWCIINDKLSIVSKVGDELSVKIIDFEKLEFVGLKNNSINCVFLDKTGNLWVGSNGGGIYKKTNSNYQFNHLNKNNTKGSLSSNKIRSLYEDQFGNLWIGTEGGGVNFLSNKAKNYNAFESFAFSKESSGVTSNNIFSVTENVIDKDNSILWFSTENGGLNKLLLNRNDKSKNFKFVKFNTPTSDGTNIKSLAIHSIYSEGKNRLWIGYYGLGLGLAEWDGAGDQPFFSYINPTNQTKEFSGKIIRDIYRDSYGILWFTTNNGLNKLIENSNDITKSNFKSYRYDSTNEKSIGSDYTLQLFESSKKTLWIGTIGGGLNKLIRDEDGSVVEFKRYSSQNKLFPDDVINSLNEDNRGLLWVGTNTGLIRFDPQKETYETYSTNELQNPGMSEISALKRNSGELIFGGVNGINVFTPDPSIKKDISPKPLITDLSIMYEPVEPMEKINNQIILNKSISHTEHITLDNNINNFSFSFSSLHYNDSKLNKYKYILEGFDKNWIETTSNLRIANYTNIRPGNYIFKVYGSNNKGMWSEYPAKVVITLSPPWYLTFWSKIVYVFSLVILVYFLRKFTIINIQRKRKLEFDRLEKEKEKEINKVKLEFFTNISHELRSPLTLILGPAEKLIKQGDALQKKERQRLYQTMQRNSDYLLKLIKQLLDFRKLDQGKIKLNCTHINLVTLLHKITDQFYTLAEQEKLELNNSLPKSKLFVWIDTNVIEKILHNLLSNAIKFTPKGGSISIGLRSVFLQKSNYPDGHVEIYVEDNGKGIRASDLKNVFNRFFQSDNQNKENEGVGIGLSFSQNLAKLHGGLIKVKSEHKKGSCFTLLIPLGNSHLSNEQMVENNEIFISKVDHTNNSVLTNDLQTSDSLPKDKPSLLIIEDNPEIYHYLTSELSHYYSTFYCIDGSQGIEMAFDKLPDIIISDIMMPKTNGIEVCRKLKNDIRTSHIPFILLSARVNDESKIEGLKSGADVYLTKPFSLEVLKTQITSLLANRKKVHSEFRKPNFEPSKIDISTLDELFIEKIITIIKENIDNPIFTVQEFSKLSGMSRTTFFNKVKSITGLKPTEFLRNYRLKLAAQFLLKGFSVKECMYKTGFNTPSYFTQSFKVLYKMTPTEYVQKTKNK
jgi:signal transduction histidine kinase/ligand-binding sensor domain-containing protein/DNA-binding response OmpR family regulator